MNVSISQHSRGCDKDPAVSHTKSSLCSRAH